MNIFITKYHNFIECLIIHTKCRGKRSVAKRSETVIALNVSLPFTDPLSGRHMCKANFLMRLLRGIMWIMEIVFSIMEIVS